MSDEQTPAPEPKAASDKKAKPKYVRFESSREEPATFSIYLGGGEQVTSAFTNGRQRIYFDVPAHLVDRFSRHEFVRNGRIVRKG